LIGGNVLVSNLYPKYATDDQVSTFHRVKSIGRSTLGNASSRSATNSFIFYQEATQYWTKATIGIPYYSKDGAVGAPAHGRYVYFDVPATAAAACAILNSSLFYAYFIAYGDCFHLSDLLVCGFPISNLILADARLGELGNKPNKSLTAGAAVKTIQTRDGSRITYAEFKASESKPILDEIDRVLAEHYGFTPEELDFIINYDIKYRMGAVAGEDDS